MYEIPVSVFGIIHLFLLYETSSLFIIYSRIKSTGFCISFADLHYMEISQYEERSWLRHTLMILKVLINSVTFYRSYLCVPYVYRTHILFYLKWMNSIYETCITDVLICRNFEDFLKGICCLTRQCGLQPYKLVQPLVWKEDVAGRPAASIVKGTVLWRCSEQLLRNSFNIERFPSRNSVNFWNSWSTLGFSSRNDFHGVSSRYGGCCLDSVYRMYFVKE